MRCFLVSETMSLLRVRSEVCMAPFYVRSKVCIAPIHVQSKFADFALPMERKQGPTNGKH